MNNYQIATTEEEWHELRSQGLGGSDIGTMLGLNPYKSKYQLWLEKTGQTQAPDISDKIAIQIGNELEDLVARMFEQETGLKVQRDNKTHYHKKHNFLIANIDRKIVGQKALLECKTTSAFSASQWDEDEIPASYLMQVQHYLNVLDYDYAYIAVIIGNHDFKYKRIDRDQELIDMYMVEAVEFWEQNVQQKIPPKIDGIIQKETIAYLSEKIEEENSMPATTEQIEIIENIQYFKEQEKLFKDQKSTFEDKLKVSMAENNLSILTGELYKVVWKTFETNRFDSNKFKKDYPDLYQKYVKTSQSNRLTIKEYK